MQKSSTMKNSLCGFLIVLAAITLVAGCIIGDELTTITIRPDGSALMVKFKSNLHSTEQGAKGAKELQKYVDEFNNHTNSDFVRITEAGGELLEARWLQREEPYSNVLTARFPTATSLENYFSVKNDQGEVVVQVKFTQDGSRRRFSLTIPASPKEPSEVSPSLGSEERRKQQAASLSETRLVVAGGQITEAQGFLVAADKRSCLLDPAQIDEVVRRQPKAIELFVAWVLDDK